MTDELPVKRPAASLADPVDDRQRVAAVGRLRELVGSGELSLEDFSVALEQVLAATSHADLEAAMAPLPVPIHLTPASRRLSQPLVVDVTMGKLELGAGWQLGAQTSVTISVAQARLDLTKATWDAREVDLRLEVTTGEIKVIVPRGVAVQIVSARGEVSLESLEQPLPGAPILRVDATATTGRIRFFHDKAPRGEHERRWWHRR